MIKLAPKLKQQQQDYPSRMSKELTKAARHQNTAPTHNPLPPDLTRQNCPEGAEEQRAAEDEAAYESVVLRGGGGEVRRG